MRYGSDRLKNALLGPVQQWWSADLFYDSERRLADVPLGGVRFQEDAAAKIQQSGSCTITWVDDFGASMSPQQIGDVFAPFGSELHLYSNVTAGKFSERVPMGVFRITGVPSAQDQTMFFRKQLITTSSVIELEFAERLARTDIERFDLPGGPSQTLSTWLELQRLTGFQVTKNVADAPVTGSLTYEDSRLDSVYDLAKILGGAPHMLSDGSLSIRPDAWGTVVDSLTRKDSLVKVGQSMTAERTYNKVVVRSPDTSNQVVLATAEITSGPLRTVNPDGSPSPYGVVPYFAAIPSITDTAAAQVYANSLLPDVSTLQAVRVPVTELINPLRERGDVITIERPTRTLTGRVVSIDRSDKATQQLVVEVQGG